MMTSAQAGETSVTVLQQDYTHPDNQTTPLHVTPGLKPFTVVNIVKVRSQNIQFRE